MSDQDHPWALCAECGQPTRITRQERRGTTYHGRCWLLKRRRDWRATDDPVRRRAIESIAAAVAAHLEPEGSS